MKNSLFRNVAVPSDPCLVAVDSFSLEESLDRDTHSLRAILGVVSAYEKVDKYKSEIGDDRTPNQERFLARTESSLEEMVTVVTPSIEVKDERDTSPTERLILYGVQLLKRILRAAKKFISEAIRNFRSRKFNEELYLKSLDELISEKGEDVSFAVRGNSLLSGNIAIGYSNVTNSAFFIDIIDKIDRVTLPVVSLTGGNDQLITDIYKMFTNISVKFVIGGKLFVIDKDTEEVEYSSKPDESQEGAVITGTELRTLINDHVALGKRLEQVNYFDTFIDKLYTYVDKVRVVEEGYSKQNQQKLLKSVNTMVVIIRAIIRYHFNVLRFITRSIKGKGVMK